MATPGMRNLSKNLLCSPFFNDLGDRRLGRGGHIVRPRPLLGSDEGGVYPGVIKVCVQGNDLRVVHFLRGNGILVQIAPSGKSYPLVCGGEILALEAVKDDSSFSQRTALCALISEGLSTPE